MTFDEYAEKYLSALTPEGRRLVQMGWNGHEEFGKEAAESLQYIRECQYDHCFPCNPCCEDFGYCSTKKIATKPQTAHCQTCNDNGMIGGPSYSQPDEGGEPCPDCSEAGVRDRLRDALAETLGDAMDCTRVWEAWGVGTMGPDDFQVIAEDDERLEEIVDAALQVIGVPTEGAE